MLSGSAAQSTRSEQHCRYAWGSLRQTFGHAWVAARLLGPRWEFTRAQVVNDAVVVPEDYLAVRVEARAFLGLDSEELV